MRLALPGGTYRFFDARGIKTITPNESDDRLCMIRYQTSIKEWPGTSQEFVDLLMSEQELSALISRVLPGD